MDAMQDHAHYFARRERHCRTLAEAHADPILRRVYEKFADNYARALKDNDSIRTAPRTGTKGHQHAAPAARKPDYT
jgi:hypothetical protein